MIEHANRSRSCVLAAFAVLVTASACDRQGATIKTSETTENTETTIEPRKNQTMSNPPQASRPPAAKIEPIEHKGVRYEQDRVDAGKGDQNGGYLAAIDPKTGEKLWRLQVYEVPDNSAAGVDNLGRYFRSMRLIPGRDEIEIENESGGRYLVDLAKRASTLVSTPEPATKPSPPLKPKPPPE